MTLAMVNLIIAAALFAGMLALQEFGRRLGERQRLLDVGRDTTLLGISEGAIFGLLGLFLAFTFSGAGQRFEERRHQVVEETNAIGTAWLRIDLLPEDRRPV